MRIIAALLAGIWLLAAPSARAGTISIVIEQTGRMEGGSFVVDLLVRNAGDEGAYTVAPRLSLLGREVQGHSEATLLPGAEMRQSLAIPGPGLAEGRWPYQIRVDYTDANQYPFQALRVMTLVLESPPPLAVALVELENARMTDTGSLEVRVKNLGDADLPVTFSAILPEGFGAEEPERQVLLKARQERSISFPLVNHSALPGSNYPAFVAVQYDDAGIHQALVGYSNIEILLPGLRLSPGRNTLALVAAALGLLFVALIVLRARRRARG